MLTTAGAAVRTTGAKLDFIAMASPGTTRLSEKTPSWAFELVGCPQAASVRASAIAIEPVFIIIRKAKAGETFPYGYAFQAGSRRRYYAPDASAREACRPTTQPITAASSRTPAAT